MPPKWAIMLNSAKAACRLEARSKLLFTYIIYLVCPVVVVLFIHSSRHPSRHPSKLSKCLCVQRSLLASPVGGEELGLLWVITSCNVKCRYKSLPTGMGISTYTYFKSKKSQRVPESWYIHPNDSSFLALNVWCLINSQQNVCSENSSKHTMSPKLLSTSSTLHIMFWIERSRKICWLVKWLWLKHFVCSICWRQRPSILKTSYSWLGQIYWLVQVICYQ